jgi:dihydroorotate dehydrogenase electron transfer subunit
MAQAEGRVTEIYADLGSGVARIACPAGMVPAPGRYLLAFVPGSDSPLAAPVFSAGPVPGGFLAAPSLPAEFLAPGAALSLRGPLGHGFGLPPSARRVALAGLDESPARLSGLIRPALEQGAAVVLLTDAPVAGLPAEVEIQPLAALAEVCAWADYLALDLPRSRLPGLPSVRWPAQAEALVLAPMPCGDLGECGVCAIHLSRGGWKLACRDGPVFPLAELLK